MLLSLAIWIPHGRRCWVLALGERYARWTALVGSMLGFLVTLPLYWSFDASSSAMQFVEFARLDRALQRQLPPRRRRHLDAVRAAEQLHHRAGGDRQLVAGRHRVAQYYAAFLILSGMLNGVFEALDAVLF